MLAVPLRKSAFLNCRKLYWDEKLYAVADQYFTRRARKAAEGEDQPTGC